MFFMNSSKKKPDDKTPPPVESRPAKVVQRRSITQAKLNRVRELIGDALYHRKKLDECHDFIWLALGEPNDLDGIDDAFQFDDEQEAFDLIYEYYHLFKEE